MTALSCVNAEFVALQLAKCAVAQRALDLARQSWCGTVSDEEWRKLTLMDRWLDVISESLNTKGCPYLASVSFAGNIVGCKMLVSINGDGICILEVLEGDTPGVGDIEKSLAAILPAMRAFFAVDGDWKFGYPLFDVERFGNALVLSIHPYYAMYAPNTYPADIKDWTLTFGMPYTCAIPGGTPPAEGWLPLEATIIRGFDGGEPPLGLRSCVGAEAIQQLFSQLNRWIGPCSDAPAQGTSLSVTSTSDCGGCLKDSLDGLDDSQVASYMAQSGIGAMGISDPCHPFVVHS